MTEKLYYEDAYMKEFDAAVSAEEIRDGSLWATLDRTAFYPEGGGQGPDTGTLVFEDGCEARVCDVQEAGGKIWHKIAAPANHACEPGKMGEEHDAGGVSGALSLAAGGKVHGIIDWQRRFYHMQQHSGEHIVSGMICEAFGCDNVGFHMGEDVITIDYNARVSLEEALDIEKRANEYIWEGHDSVETHPPAEELARLEYRSKKELTGDVRIIAFPGADRCACCGTHVRNSAQVGLVKIVSAKNFHDGTRIEMLAGAGAMNYLSSSWKAAKETAVMLSTKEEKIASVVKKLSEESAEKKDLLASVEKKYFELLASSLENRDKVFIMEESFTPEQGRRLADKIAGAANVAVVVTKSGSAYRYSAISRQSDVTALAEKINKGLKGRGGGRGGFAQGSLSASAREIREFFAREDYHGN